MLEPLAKCRISTLRTQRRKTAWWRSFSNMNADTGATAIDTVQGNDGVIVNADWATQP